MPPEVYTVKCNLSTPLFVKNNQSLKSFCYASSPNRTARPFGLRKTSRRRRIIKLRQYESLFQQISPLKKQHDERALQQGEHFNLFKILNIHTDEVRLHSRFLAEFLNPKGAHLQGSKFLKLFIQQSFPDFDFNVETAKVKIEKAIDNNPSLDIYLRDDKRREIIIENKIYAGDQNKQLYDYHEFAKKSAQEII